MLFYRKFSRRNTLKFAQKSQDEKAVIQRISADNRNYHFVKKFFSALSAGMLFGRKFSRRNTLKFAQKSLNEKAVVLRISADNRNYNFVKKFFISAFSAGKAVLQEVFP